MVLMRLAMLARRRMAANRLRVPFVRSASFAMPASIWLGSREVPLRLPPEGGVRTAFVELLLDDCYRLRRLKHERIEHVIDIGANVGLFGLAARAAFPTATIHAYEPNPALEHNLLHQARGARFDVFLEAVGREAGRVRLDVNEAESVHTSSHLDPAGTIPQVALRTAIERIGGSVDLLKMDCEGAEWEMLEDLESWSAARFVTMEYHLRPGLDHESICGALGRCGFHIVDQRRIDTYGLVLARR
jgi:FkbM family methyltransferase